VGDAADASSLALRGGSMMLETAALARRQLSLNSGCCSRIRIASGCQSHRRSKFRCSEAAKRPKLLAQEIGETRADMHDRGRWYDSWTIVRSSSVSGKRLCCVSISKRGVGGMARCEAVAVEVRSSRRGKCAANRTKQETMEESMIRERTTENPADTRV
jgi:hypothetical protein